MKVQVRNFLTHIDKSASEMPILNSLIGKVVNRLLPTYIAQAACNPPAGVFECSVEVHFTGNSYCSNNARFCERNIWHRFQEGTGVCGSYCCISDTGYYIYHGCETTCPSVTQPYCQ